MAVREQQLGSGSEGASTGGGRTERSGGAGTRWIGVDRLLAARVVSGRWGESAGRRPAVAETTMPVARALIGQATYGSAGRPDGRRRAEREFLDGRHTHRAEFGGGRDRSGQTHSTSHTRTLTYTHTHMDARTEGQAASQNRFDPAAARPFSQPQQSSATVLDVYANDDANAHALLLEGTGGGEPKRSQSLSAR